MIAKGNWDSFLTLNGERLLLVKHQHKFVLFFPILLTILLAIIFTVSSFVFYAHFLYSPVLLIASLLLFASLALTIISKIIVDWYYHFYILTTRKILEVGYSPLSALMINDVLLDKVNCTEIDVRTHGLLGE